MNGQNSRFLVALGFYLSLAVLAGLAIFSFFSTRDLIYYNDLLNLSLKVREALDEARGLVLEAESSQRGFILTGNELFLTAYRKEIKDIPAKVTELRKLTAGRPRSQQLLDTLEPLVGRKLYLLQARISALEAGNPEVAVQSIKSGVGLRLMGNINTVIGDLEKEENQVLSERQAGVEKMRRRALLARVIGGPLSFGILILVFWCLKREVKARRRTAEALRLSEERLRVFMENSPAISFMKDTAGQYVFVNGLIEQLTSRKPGELVGKTDLQLWPFHLAQEIQAMDRQVFAEEKPVEIMAALPDRYGNTLDFLIYEFPIPNHQGKRILGGVAVDITQRRAAEAALQRAAQEFRMVVNNIPAVVFKGYVDGTVDFFDDRVEHLTGYAREEFEIRRRPWPDLILSEDLSSAKAAFVKALKGSGLYVREYRIATKAAEVLWIQERSCIVRHPDGMVDYVSGVFFDITARKRGEQKLQRANRALQTLSQVNQTLVYAVEESELLQDICLLITGVGGYRLAWIALAQHDEKKTVSPLASAGIEADFLAGLDISWADDETGSGPTGTAIRTNQTVLVNDIREDLAVLSWRDKIASQGLASLISLPLAIDGDPWGALTIYALERNAFDVDEVALLEELAQDVRYGIASLRARKAHRQAEAALRDSEEKFRGLFETSPDVVAQTDLNLNFLEVNNRAEPLFGCESAAQLIGTSLLDLIDPADHPQVLASAKQLLQTGMLKDAQYTFVRKDGTPFPGETSATVTLDAAGGPKAFTGTIRDITARKEAEKSLQESFERLRASLEGTVAALSAVVESKDPYTAGHQKMVAHLACAIGREMGLSQDQIDGIQVMGYLHDIGKIAVPAEILSRPGKITEIEFSLIKQHPASGFDILKQISFPWPVAQAVLQHHERLNGSGYPAGSTDKEIILEARVLAVADVVEAMASHRPYRPAMGIDKALEEIIQNQGILYDPEVAQACVRLFRERHYAFE